MIKIALTQLIKVSYPVRKNPNMELQLDKILCLTLGHCSSINSCKCTWFLPTELKNYNKRQNRFKIDGIKYAAYKLKGML